MLTPEFTWRLCIAIFWAGVAYTILCNLLDCPEATISAVLAKKAADNYWIPAVCVGLVCHWFWPVK